MDRNVNIQPHNSLYYSEYYPFQNRWLCSRSNPILLSTITAVILCFKMISINKLKPTGSRLSAYALSLQRNSPDVYKRYIDKIRCIFFNDPYTGEIQQSDLPLNVTTGHVVEYFLNFRSPYTGNPMKNSRSLEGYKKYEAGFVHSVSGKIVNGNYVIVGKVM